MNVQHHDDLEHRIASALHAAGSQGDQPTSDWAGVQRLARRNQVRRYTTLVASSVVVVALAAGFAVALGGERSRAPESASPPAAATVTRPVLDACQALTATEFDVAASPGTEVFAEDTTGAAGVVALARGLSTTGTAGDGRVETQAANATVAGREAVLQSRSARTFLRYERADGSVREIVGRGLEGSDLLALATRLESGSGPFPRGLGPIGAAGPVHVAQSTCAQHPTNPFLVVSLTGDAAGRIAYLLDVLTVSSVWDEGRSTLLTNGTATSRPVVRQASETDWNELLRTGTSGSPTTAVR